MKSCTRDSLVSSTRLGWLGTDKCGQKSAGTAGLSFQHCEERNSTNWKWTAQSMAPWQHLLQVLKEIYHLSIL